MKYYVSNCIFVEHTQVPRQVYVHPKGEHFKLSTKLFFGNDFFASDDKAICTLSPKHMNVVSGVISLLCLLDDIVKSMSKLVYYVEFILWKL